MASVPSLFSQAARGQSMPQPVKPNPRRAALTLDDPNASLLLSAVSTAHDLELSRVDEPRPPRVDREDRQRNAQATLAPQTKAGFSAGGLLSGVCAARFASHAYEGPGVACVHAMAVALGVASAWWMVDAVMMRAQRIPAATPFSVPRCEAGYCLAFFGSFGIALGLLSATSGDSDPQHLVWEGLSPSSLLIFMVQAARGLRWKQAAAARAPTAEHAVAAKSFARERRSVAAGILIPITALTLRWEKTASETGTFLWQQRPGLAGLPAAQAKYLDVVAETMSPLASLCMLVPIIMQSRNARARAGHARVMRDEIIMAGVGTGIGVVAAIPQLIIKVSNLSATATNARN